MENAHTNLNQLSQGLMVVKEYSAMFRSLTAKLHDWPESLIMDYYCDGLNTYIMSKVIEQPQHLSKLDSIGCRNGSPPMAD